MKKPQLTLRFFHGGDDCRIFELKKALKFSELDKIISKLRKIYREHPEWFDLPNSIY
jgi:hypothetical protein